MSDSTNNETQFEIDTAPHQNPQHQRAGEFYPRITWKGTKKTHIGIIILEISTGRQLHIDAMANVSPGETQVFDQFHLKEGQMLLVGLDGQNTYFRVVGTSPPKLILATPQEEEAVFRKMQEHLEITAGQ